MAIAAQYVPISTTYSNLTVRKLGSFYWPQNTMPRISTTTWWRCSENRDTGRAVNETESGGPRIADGGWPGFAEGRIPATG